MKKLHVILIAATMSFALCACGTEENTLKQDIEKTTSEISKSQQAQKKKPSYLELDKVLDEINTEIKQGTAGSGSTSIKVAAHLLNWGVGTSMTTDEIKKETINWLSDKGNSEQVEFSNKLASVYEVYNRLLGSDAKQLLESAGCDDAAYPWSDSPVETIEAIAEAVRLPDE